MRGVARAGLGVAAAVVIVAAQLAVLVSMMISKG